MHTWFDSLFVAAYAVAWPFYDTRYRLPRVRAAIEGGDASRRVREYRFVMLLEWTLTAIAIALVLYGTRPLSSIGLRWPTGPGLGWTIAIVGAGVALLALQHHAATGSDAGRAAVRRQLASMRWFSPGPGVELAHFRALSITAGVCEEILFRGYLPAFLSPFVGVWLAVLVSSVLFGFAHVYLGATSGIRAGVVGLVMAGMYAATGSLLAPMIVHAMIDWSSGQIAAQVPPVEGTATSSA